MTPDFFGSSQDLVAASARGQLHFHGILSAQGGAARVMRLLALGAKAQGFKTSLSCEFKDTDDPEVRELDPLSLGGHVLPETLCHIHGSRAWGDLFRGFSVLGQRVDIITMHDCALLTGGCIHPQNCPGWRDGCVDECPQSYKEAILSQNILRHSAQEQAPVLVSPSAWLRGMARAVLPDLKCVLIPNGVEDPFLTMDRQAARRSLGLAPGTSMLLFAAHGGALAPAKGLADFFELWRAVKVKAPETVAFIVGGEKVSREGDIFYWPYADTPTMQRFMLAADIFVSASPAENHSLVILEAMAAGVPVCAYKTGGVPEQVVHGDTGLLAPLGDVTALTAAVLRLLADPGLKRKLGLGSRTRYERNFRVERMVDDYIRLYIKTMT